MALTAFWKTPTTNLTTKSTLATATTSTTTEKSMNFVIRIAKCEDHERLLNFLREYYYTEEPLTIGGEPKRQDPADEEFTMSNIVHGTCLMAVTKSAENDDDDADELIVAAVMAGPKDRHEVEHLFEEAAAFGESKWGRILKILACIERSANVFERFNVERAVHAHALGVHRCYRGHALGARMMKELIAIARKLNYQVLTVDCTSVYSARLCERLGMELVNSLRYDEYLDEQGNQIFSPPLPHDVIETYALRL